MIIMAKLPELSFYCFLTHSILQIYYIPIIIYLQISKWRKTETEANFEGHDKSFYKKKLRNVGEALQWSLGRYGNETNSNFSSLDSLF